MRYKPGTRGKAAPQSEIDGCLCPSLVLINIISSLYKSAYNRADSHDLVLLTGTKREFPAESDFSS